MRTLTIADNWKDWKFGDTDAVMTFTALDDDKVPDFSDRTLTFKIASTLNNDLEHPKDFAATATGYIQGKNVILKTEDVKQLTPGNYIVELWAMSNDTQKDAVYPSKGFAQFTIEENSMKVSDVTNIPSMTINAFWNAVMQKVRTLTKGAKGDPGKTPKIVIGSVTKLSPDAQPSATLVPLQSDPNTYTLNLQLPQGVQGEQGLQGIPGVGSKGLDGNNGLTPTIDPKTKHWMIGGTDTGVIAEGQAGKDADPSKYVTIVSFNQLRQQVQSNATALAQKAGKFELEDKLAQMNLQPEMYADLNAVQAAYPNGATKLIATDDGYLALYRNGQWIKGPIYQAIGLDDKTKTAIANSVKGMTNIYQLDQLVPPYDDIRTIPVNSVVTYSVDVTKIKHVPDNISTFTAMRIGFKTGNPSGSVTMLLDDKGHLYTSYTYGDTDNYKYTPWVASKSNRNNRNIYQSNQVVAPYDDLHTIPANSTVLYSVDVSKIKHIPDTDQLGLGSILVQTTSYDDDNLSGGRIDVTEIATGRQWHCRVTGNPGAYHYSRWTYVESEAKNRNIYQLGQLVAPYDDLNTLPSDSKVLYSVDVTKIKNFPLEYKFGTVFVQTQSFAENTKSGARQIITNYDGREAVRFITGVEGHYSFTPWKLYAFENIQSYLEPSLSMFEHFAVIGDSYGSGTLFFDDKWGGNDNLQWGLMLAKKYGTTYTRMAIGGISTRTWLTDEQGLKKLNSSDPQDIYYLCLGINDEAILEKNADYLGSVADIDNGSDTFYGNYGRIIKAIKAKAPKARIIMFGLSQTMALYPQITKAIKGIAEYVHVPYQPLDDPLFSSSYYLNQSGGHPVGPVYGAMAEAYARLIKKCVVTNPDYFRRYGWQN